ncbi:hypothetical protein Hdeb2414_s0017g00501941 [Helianthus debilis subsp. tardiflorus]
MKKRSNLEITLPEETKPKKSTHLISFSQFTLTTPNYPISKPEMQRVVVKDQHSSKPVKAVTIHACAQSGDVAGVQKRVRENPALVNDRNPVI